LTVMIAQSVNVPITGMYVRIIPLLCGFGLVYYLANTSHPGHYH
jgi:hypothetical protein